MSKASNVKANLSYLLRGPASSLQPASLTTRSTLRSLRYVFKFAFWRLVRYFVSFSRRRREGGELMRAFSQKYAAVAAGCTALAGTMAGAALPWVAAIAVPSVPVAAAIGLTTAAIKVRLSPSNQLARPADSPLAVWLEAPRKPFPSRLESRRRRSGCTIRRAEGRRGGGGRVRQAQRPPSCWQGVGLRRVRLRARNDKM